MSNPPQPSPTQVMLGVASWLNLLHAALVVDVGVSDREADRLSRKVLKHVLEWGGADVQVLDEQGP